MLIVPGMLNELAQSLQVSTASAGQLISAIALAVAFCAPLLAVATSRIDRRVLLVSALLGYALLHGAAACTTSFAILLGLRFLAGLGPAIVTPQGAATAAMLVPAPARAGAVATVFLGFSIASVVGLPLGAHIGAEHGWQVGMWIIAVLSLIAAGALAIVIPRGLKVQPLAWSAWLEVMRHRRILLLVLLTVLQSGGQFVLFSYMAPVLRDNFQSTPAMISMLFGWFGLWG